VPDATGLVAGEDPAGGGWPWQFYRARSVP